MVIDFIEYISQNLDTNSIKFNVAHKQFTLLTKIVDLIIEPLAHEDGLNFYENGLNLAYSNLLYYVLRSTLGEEFYLNMLNKFQIMMRCRSTASYNDFYSIFFDYDFPDHIEEVFVNTIKASHYRHGYYEILNLPEESLDIAFSEVFNLASSWSLVFGDSYTIIHDKSSTMAKNKKMWDYVVSQNIPQKTVGYDRRKMTFPLKVLKTELCDSEKYIGLQIADILAGAMTKSFSWCLCGQDSSDGYGNELASLLPDKFNPHMIWPTPAFTPEEVDATDTDAEDPIDHFIDLIRNMNNDKGAR